MCQFWRFYSFPWYFEDIARKKCGAKISPQRLAGGAEAQRSPGYYYNPRRHRVGGLMQPPSGFSFKCRFRIFLYIIVPEIM